METIEKNQIDEIATQVATEILGAALVDTATTGLSESRLGATRRYAVPRRRSPGLADACAATCPGLLDLAIEVARQDPSGSSNGSGSQRDRPLQD